ncbi:hypothetical protein C8T65DRAFT_89919 [Cerioporus squamosus]|nr:hypothetical protein C8T65DRAFT_89919 [Cerioporus squamosus]
MPRLVGAILRSPGLLCRPARPDDVPRVERSAARTHAHPTHGVSTAYLTPCHGTPLQQRNLLRPIFARNFLGAARSASWLMRKPWGVRARGREASRARREAGGRVVSVGMLGKDELAARGALSRAGAHGVLDVQRGVGSCLRRTYGEGRPRRIYENEKFRPEAVAKGRWCSVRSCNARMPGGVELVNGRCLVCPGLLCGARWAGRGCPCHGDGA